jgi:hypothetical protein
MQDWGDKRARDQLVDAYNISTRSSSPEGDANEANAGDWRVADHKERRCSHAPLGPAVAATADISISEHPFCRRDPSARVREACRPICRDTFISQVSSFSPGHTPRRTSG